MLDPILVETAILSPYSCVQCMGSIGPMLDTHIELPGHGRVYLCKTCLVRDSGVIGLSKGKRMNELLNLDKTLSKVEADVRERDELIVGLRDTVQAQSGTIDRLEKALRDSVNREQTRVHMIEQLAGNLRDLAEVGVDAAILA